jgi:maleate cis-trans isomerase
MLDMFDHAKIQPDEIYRKVKEIATPEAEAVFVACTQLRALEVVELLERDLGKPVYSAVQASAWQAFEAMGVDPQIDDCGSLLRRLSEPGKKAPPIRRSA